MKRNKKFRAGISLLLLAAMLLTLCGCGREASPAAPEEEVPEEKAEAATAPSAPLAWDIASDSVLQEHAAHNAALGDRFVAPRSADVMDIYVTNTKCMTGFCIGEDGVSDYQDAMQSIFDAGNDMFGNEKITGHYLDGGTDGELCWEETEGDSRFRRDVQKADFYSRNELPEEGAIPMMFWEGSPFKTNGLTVLVSSLYEPGFDLTRLSGGIERYFEENTNSAAAVIGLPCSYSGRLYVPQFDSKYSGTTFYVRDIHTCVDHLRGNDKPDSFDIPVYMILTGPQEAVRDYLEVLKGYMDNRSLNYEYAIYSNTACKDIQAPALSFVPALDQKAKKISEYTMTSYNTGELSGNEAGTVFCSTYGTVVSRGLYKLDENKVTPYADNQVDVMRSTQITLFSDNYDKNSRYSADFELYVYENGGWVKAPKGARGMVTLDYGLATGEITEVNPEFPKGVVLMPAGNQEVYLMARMYAKEGSEIDRNKIYRMEVSLKLNRDQDQLGGSHNPELSAMSVSTSEFNGFLRTLGGLAKPNCFVKPSEAAEALNLLRRTPNLEAFLTSLENLEKKFNGDDAEIEYVDILFNIPGKKGR